MAPRRTNNTVQALVVLLSMCAAPVCLQQSRDQRSIGPPAQRTAQRMMGGYMRINSNELVASAAGEGKQKKDAGEKDDDDAKTLSDQVKEGKYGLIQDEIFTSPPKRPGVIAYEANDETKDKDNNKTLGGLTKDDIWLAEGHLLVLKGGEFPQATVESDARWPAIDDYQAPRRQVKIPKKPKVPPPFPVQLEDGGPVVFVTSDGGRIPVPALGRLPPPGFYPPPYPFDPYPGDFAPGRAPFPPPAVPGANFPGGRPEGLPPLNGSVAGIRPPPEEGNEPDDFDEDDPSLYYPPPYSFSYKVANSTVPAGPLVPGIVLPPPPDFFQLENSTDKSSTTSTTTPSPLFVSINPPFTTLPPFTTTTIVPQIVPTIPPRPITVFIRNRPKPQISPIELTRGFVPIIPNRPIVVDTPDNSIDYVTTTTPRPVYQRPELIIIPKPIPPKPTEIPYRRPKPTRPPPSVSIVYDDSYLNTNSVNQQHKPFLVYGLPPQNSYVSTTPVPLKAYYGPDAQQYFKPNTPYFKPAKAQNANPLTSYYFYDEKTTAAPFYNRPNIYQSDFFGLPPRQGSRTLTQEYFSVQQPQQQNNYVSQLSSPDFFKQIAEIQQTIDLYTTPRPNTYYRPAAPAKVRPSKPLYQYSFQSQGAPRNSVSNLFRAPVIDSEPFRPMVAYSDPYEVRYQSTPKPYEVRYQSTPKPNYQYLVETQSISTESSVPQYATAAKKPGTVKTRLENTFIYADIQSTSAPGQDEYDDATQRYFTAFGQKLDGTATPQPTLAESIVDNTINSLDDDKNAKIEISLKDDTLVNYRDPRPPINPDSEFVPIADPSLKGEPLGSYRFPGASLEGDTLVNYRDPRPKVNANGEFVAFRSLNARLEAERRFRLLRQQVEREKTQAPSRPQSDAAGAGDNAAGEGRPGSFVSYRLPGQGAHVYFLTPRAAQNGQGIR